MENREFTDIVQHRLNLVMHILIKKGNVYAFKDRLSNFKDAAGFLHCTPERVLWGYVTKHIIALNDFISTLENGGTISSDELEEKIGDIIAYMFLLETVLIDRGVMPDTICQEAKND